MTTALDQGRALLAQKRFPEAVATLKRALEAAPRDARTAALLAEAHEGAGELMPARQAWLHAARCAPRHPLPARRAVALLAREGHFEQAAGLLAAYVKNFPTELAVRGDLARLELGLGRVAKARDVALGLIRDAKSQPALEAEGNLLAGLAFMLLSKSQLAEMHLLEARRLAPEAVEVWTALAKLKRLQRDLVKTEQILLEARERFPRAFAPANDLGLLYLRARAPEKRAQAIGLFETAARNAPDDVDVYLNLALAWKATNPARALGCAKRAATSTRTSVQKQAQRLITQLSR